jgi:hypothetical protein
VVDSFEEKSFNRSFLIGQLEEYEKAAQAAVEGNLDLLITEGDDESVQIFPSKAEKWTLMQAIFFASTVCTTIGKHSMLNVINSK